MLTPTNVIGDSITENALLPSEICGRRVINAGIGGFTAGDYLPFAKEIMPTAAAVLTVVAIGTNEAYKGVTATAQLWRDDRPDPPAFRESHSGRNPALRYERRTSQNLF
jgi:hypothetical protein